MKLPSSSPPWSNPKRSVGALVQALSQTATNGNSVLGTVEAPRLPAYLTDGPLANGSPWATRDSSSNYHTDYPVTGLTRSYDFTISRDFISPDGYERDVLLINGAFPGPLIEANWGDVIQVTVHNNITGPEEGTALHWHGFFQQGTPWEDGVPSVHQCPIAPGQTYTYQFPAHIYGTTWYHGHYSAQYAGGLFGPLVVHGPAQAEYDVDLGPVMLTDWYHAEYYDLVEEVMSPEGFGVVFSDSNLINGKGTFNCSSLGPEDDNPCENNAGISQFRFRRGQTHRLRLMNTGADAMQQFSIDGHRMTVIANDFVAVEPYETEVVTLGIGQRTDVLVVANGDTDAYWMRTSIPAACGHTNNPNGVAAIFYEGADETQVPQSQPWDVPASETCANDDLTLTRPVVAMPLPEPDLTLDMDVALFRNETNHTLWSFGGVSGRGNANSPTLLMADRGNLTFAQEWNVVNTGNASSVRINVYNGSPAAHPMHLHGFDMYVLHEGPGRWNGTIIRPENPQRRDVNQVRANGHLVIQFDAASNPGIWPFHCHIAWHVSAGFFAQFLTNPDAVESMRIPGKVAETCQQWEAWTDANIPEQIDSGL
ncbi:hypothetical protein S40293_01741 [Stachybotrys chartarum IBT 40293]|nr:hypothetical protein S40293_01741 [Stachybotrys chartarum IBT 40293]